MFQNRKLRKKKAEQSKQTNQQKPVKVLIEKNLLQNKETFISHGHLIYQLLEGRSLNHHLILFGIISISK